MNHFILALGNPGEKYKNTRHNIAWIVLDTLFDGDWEFNKYGNSEMTSIQIGENDILLIKPQTFMNKSGEVIPFFKKEYDLETEKLIVIHDEIDLPLGKIKISFDRGDGGHNGIKSMMNHLNSKEFIRIRIGISKKIENGELIKLNVLGNFNDEEVEVLKDIIPEIKKILETIILKGKEKAMNKFN